VLGHATGAAYAQHPSVPSVHVASVFPTHEVWPAEQLLVQVDAHAAFGASPEHDSVLAHVCAEAT